jgi:hypothetical protein
VAGIDRGLIEGKYSNGNTEEKNKKINSCTTAGLRAENRNQKLPETNLAHETKVKW